MSLTIRESHGDWSEKITLFDDNNSNNNNGNNSNSRTTPTNHNERKTVKTSAITQDDDVRTTQSSLFVDRLGVIFSSFAAMFVPHGFPGSVSPDYAKFQRWDCVQGLCSYLRGILTTHALLEGVGVGKEEASALAATVQWIYRDGAGMIGSLVFTWVGTGAGSGQGFDSHVKRWRLFADVINDIGLSLELIAPMFPKHFTLCVCVASVCKSMCGVAAGATRAVLTSHFAIKNNLADVAAKEGTQETAVTLIGMLFGLGLTRLLGEQPNAIWFAFWFLTAVHVVANFIAVTALCLRTINTERLQILCEQYAQSKPMTFAAVSHKERILPTVSSTSLRFKRTGLGVRLSTLDLPLTQAKPVLQELETNGFAVVPRGEGHARSTGGIGSIGDGSISSSSGVYDYDVILSEYATAQDITAAMLIVWHALNLGTLCSIKYSRLFANELMVNGWEVELDKLLLLDQGFRVSVEH